MNFRRLLRRVILVSFFIALRSHGEHCLQQNNVQEKIVFLTGAAGFIGSNFLEYLFHKYPSYQFFILDALTYAGSLDNISPEILSSPRVTFVHGSVTNIRFVDALMRKAHFVVHFAAESHVTRSIHDSYACFDADVMGTRALMDSLTRHPNVERFIHISTSEVLGTAEMVPMSEDHPIKPRTPYAAAKAGADRLVYAYQCAYDTPSLIVRPFNNYGPRQHVEKLIPRFITHILQNESIIVHGDGSQTRDWLHVIDTCRALDMILHHANFESIKHQVINIGSGKETSVIDIADTLLKYLKISDKAVIFTKDRPGQVFRHIASIEKAEKLLGWKPTIDLEQGLVSVVAWYSKNHLWWKSRLQMKEIDISWGGDRVLM